MLKLHSNDSHACQSQCKLCEMLDTFVALCEKRPVQQINLANARNYSNILGRLVYPKSEKYQYAHMRNVNNVWLL